MPAATPPPQSPHRSLPSRPRLFRLEGSSPPVSPGKPPPHTASKFRLGYFAAEPRDLRVKPGLLRSRALVRGLQVDAAALKTAAAAPEGLLPARFEPVAPFFHTGVPPSLLLLPASSSSAGCARRCPPLPRCGSLGNRLHYARFPPRRRARPARAPRRLPPRYADLAVPPPSLSELSPAALMPPESPSSAATFSVFTAHAYPLNASSTPEGCRGITK